MRLDAGAHKSYFWDFDFTTLSEMLGIRLDELVGRHVLYSNCGVRHCDQFVWGRE